MSQSDSLSTEELYKLLQKTYFDSIDDADTETAISVMHEDVEWVHTQVWEEDGHTSQKTDTITGRENVFEFLDGRLGEMKDKGIEHTIRDTVAADGKGSFRADIVEPDGNTIPFLGWVELTDGKISKYIVAPERMPE